MCACAMNGRARGRTQTRRRRRAGNALERRARTVTFVNSGVLTDGRTMFLVSRELELFFSVFGYILSVLLLCENLPLNNSFLSRQSTIIIFC